MKKKFLTTTVILVGFVSSLTAVSFTPDMSNWYPFMPQNQTADNALGLSDWNADRAGASGRITSDGDILIYNGNPIKLWGLNNEYYDCYPEKHIADFRAAFYARQGFNSVRQHKYNDVPGWGGIGTRESMVEFDPELLDRFDYYNAKLIENGIFLNLSSNFGVKYGSADAHRFEAHEDFAKGENPFSRSSRIKTGGGAVFLSPGLQELQIEQLVKILEHTNPYTGKTYAEDPGVVFVEIFNEDSILFYGTNNKLRQSPILRANTAKRFARWLESKYGTESAWRQAWGKAVIDASDPKDIENSHLRHLISPKDFRGELKPESFANGVVPWGQPWFWDVVSKPTEYSDFIPLHPRLLDSMEFLISLQNEFYDNAVAAIRNTGYAGEILASNWQAGSMTGHFWNLHSDARIGTIDRHNYFGGKGRGLNPRDNWKPINNASQLDQPGSALLSSGLQQVDNRPFMLSEWNVVQPNEWYLEGPTIIGAYGMGLQGWDVSYIFASYQDGGFSKNLDDVKKFSIDTPPIMGLMPIISRMVRRGDIAESEETAIRHVSMENLRTGQFEFQDFTDQAHDLKSFDGDKIPSETIAAARTAVRFDSEESTQSYDFGDREAQGGITASTGQLFWTESEGTHNDYFTINTTGTQGFIGFAEAGDKYQQGSFSITPEPGFGAIIMTASSADQNIATDDSALIVAMARARNTGMTFSEDGGTLLTVGKGPILLEPIRATIQFGSLPVASVEILDHDGQRTGKYLTIDNNSIRIDTARDQSPYYKVHMR